MGFRICGVRVCVGAGVCVGGVVNKSHPIGRRFGIGLLPVEFMHEQSFRRLLK